MLCHLKWQNFWSGDSNDLIGNTFPTIDRVAYEQTCMLRLQCRLTDYLIAF